MDIFHPTELVQVLVLGVGRKAVRFPLGVKFKVELHESEAVLKNRSWIY